MPPARPCLDCQRPTRNGSRCPTCALAHEQRRGQRRGKTAARGYGSAWQRLSRQAIIASPICAVCGATDDLTTDHPVALARGGDRLPDIGELTVLCRPCNSAKGAR